MMIDLISGAELAARLRFEGRTGAFRKFCHDTGIRPVPGRKDCYDPVAVRQRLDSVQGLTTTVAAENVSLLEMSRVRRNVKKEGVYPLEASCCCTGCSMRAKIR